VLKVVFYGDVMAIPTKTKKVKVIVKMQVAAGKANPAPPVGSSLGPHGIQIMEFCKAFNEKTKDMEVGMPVPSIITIYEDRSFTFTLKSPPTSYLLKKAAGITSGAKEPGSTVVGSVTMKDVMNIVAIKKADLSAYDEAQACKIVIGSARSMGIDVSDDAKAANAA
jgi:large subunit ribosomal protein L11